jgi:hypothetical protein
MLAQNLDGGCDQPSVYASRLLSTIEQNYMITKQKVLAMVYDSHKFKHYLLGNNFVFFVHHMVLTYLVHKP